MLWLKLSADGLGVGITCSNTDGVLRAYHSRAQHCIAREARRAGVHVMAEVLGAFTRAALRDADLEKCEEYLRAQASWPAETGDRARSTDRHSSV
jgi:hypothetical protein